MLTKLNTMQNVIIFSVLSRRSPELLRSISGDGLLSDSILTGIEEHLIDEFQDFGLNADSSLNIYGDCLEKIVDDIQDNYPIDD